MTERKGKAELIDVKELLARDQDFVRTALEALLQAALEAEMTEAVGAAKGERTETRLAYRSGYYGRSLITRVGALELRVPQDRLGRFSTELFARYRCIAQPERLLEPQHFPDPPHRHPRSRHPLRPPKGAKLAAITCRAAAMPKPNQGAENAEIGGRIGAKSGAAFRRNHLPISTEIRCRFAPIFADWKDGSAKACANIPVNGLLGACARTGWMAGSNGLSPMDTVAPIRAVRRTNGKGGSRR